MADSFKQIENKGEIMENGNNTREAMFVVWVKWKMGIIHHLFFTCKYSAKCLKQIKEWMEWRCARTDLLEILELTRKTKQVSKSCKRVLYVLCITNGLDCIE